MSRSALLYGIGFTGNVVVPRSIDHGLAAPPDNAILIDLLLLGLFAVQYHFTARRIEHGTDALFGSLALFLLYWQWRTLPTVIWDVPAPARPGPHVLFWLGWAVVVLGANGIRRRDCFELRIRYFMWRESPSGRRGFGSQLLFWPARHPTVSGLVVALWATPVMTSGHLLFAVAATGFIVAVVRGAEHGSRRRSALAAAVITELSGTVFPALRQATVFPGSPRPGSPPPRRCRPSSLRPPPARRSGSRRLPTRT
ncbi:isoprenylcysteine carboxylmethyltransferase family protein [Mycobacterium terramassiliense]|uniref:isoprenylcysteine carboxylmethyltransferase family protein n=1 Tax=Mycobacterium terramassiliense TaxID=1841859 RepID=UPI0012FF9A1B|nr:isoprenylcysteine carboxylmethyltransferase family protein [Mycobacterium terramassiliense]